MKWLDSLEVRYGRMAIPGLILLNVLVFLLLQIYPEFLYVLELDPVLVRKGEVWRLFSYIFIPPVGGSASNLGLVWLLFNVTFLWFIGDGLEHAWGPFKLNVFYFMGMIGCAIGSFFFPGSSAGVYLNLSLLFAFATIFPNEIITLFFILPLKMKWVAYIAFAFEMLKFLGGTLNIQIAIIISLGNYILFFMPLLVETVRHRQQVIERRQRFEKELIPEEEALHHCAICKRTEKTNPELDFRVSKDGNEYCTAHLPKPVSAPVG